MFKPNRGFRSYGPRTEWKTPEVSVPKMPRVTRQDLVIEEYQRNKARDEKRAKRLDDEQLVGRIAGQYI